MAKSQSTCNEISQSKKQKSMAKNKISRLLSIERAASGNTATPTKPLRPDSPSNMWYTSISRLPLSKFIECLVDNNLSALTIAGYPTEQQLTAAWADVYEQYTNMIGDSDHKMYIKLYKEISLLSLEITMINELVQILSCEAVDFRPDLFKPFMDRLNRMLFARFHFTAHRMQELKKCLSLSKSLVIQHDLKSQHFAQIRKKFESVDTKPSREYFTSVMITLSDFSKFALSDSMTTFEFCERINRYSNYVNQQKMSHGRR